MPTINELLNFIAIELGPVSDNPRFEAELLLSHFLNITRSKLLGSLKDNVESGLSVLNGWIERRKKYEPLAYIIGHTVFFGLKILTVPPIFIPRPETELLVEKSLDFIQALPAGEIHILELCTGTGCISIAICKNTRKSTYIIAVDIDEKAVQLAKKNALFNDVEIQFVVGDLLLPINPNHKFDIIIANPPYVGVSQWDDLSPTIKNYESHIAIICKEEGLEVIRKIINNSKDYLKTNGFLLLEISEEQENRVKSILENEGFKNVQIYLDLQGLPRVAVAQFLR